MNDLKNKPEGATRFNKACAYSWLKKDSKGVVYFMPNTGWQYYTSSDIGMNAWNASILVSIDDWSIYNNTLPLSELSDEQRGLLFNHKCNSGNIEAKSTIGWLESSLWNMSWVYRAKQKTERELFIDEWSSKIATNEYNGGSIKLLVGKMFDSAKAPKVGE
jgi:hypothetical protein